MAISTPERNMLDSELYDHSAGYEDDRGIQVSSGLSREEQREAAALFRLFDELWGLAIVRGEPGAGKDTFLNWMLYRCKRYYPYKRILRDEKPRPLFGPYAGLFTRETIKEELDKMRQVAKSSRGNGEGTASYLAALEKAADEWATSDGAKVLLQNAVLGSTEYWKWVYNREPHKPENKAMGGIHKMARHMNLLVVGCVQQESDIDKKTSKPFIKWRITCSRPSQQSTQYTFIVERVKYDRRRDLLIPFGRPTTIPVDAGKPRSFMGDGKIVIRKPNYVPDSPEEALIFNAVRSGIDKYEDLVLLMDAAGVGERETLSLLKDMCLKIPGRKPKFALWYPCDYFTFNSKSTPNLETSIKMGD